MLWVAPRVMGTPRRLEMPWNYHVDAQRYLGAGEYFGLQVSGSNERPDSERSPDLDVWVIDKRDDLQENLLPSSEQVQGAV